MTTESTYISNVLKNISSGGRDSSQMSYYGVSNTAPFSVPPLTASERDIEPSSGPAGILTGSSLDNPPASRDFTRPFSSHGVPIPDMGTYGKDYTGSGLGLIAAGFGAEQPTHRMIASGLGYSTMDPNRMNSNRMNSNNINSNRINITGMGHGKPMQKRSTYEPGFDYVGGDYQQLSVPSYKVCEQDCLEHPSCNAWTFNTTNNQCYLKQNPHRVAKLQAISGRIGEDNPMNPFHKSSTYEPGFDYVGGDYDHLITSSYKDCEQNCLNHPSCKEWTFNNNNSECYLKQHPQRVAKVQAISGRILENNNVLPRPQPHPNPHPNPRPPVPPPNPRPNPRPPVPPPNPTSKRSTYEPGFDYVGGDYQQLAVPSYGVCEQDCLQHPSCNAWTFNTDNNQCHLKQHPQRVAKTQAVSGRIMKNNPTNPLQKTSTYEPGFDYVGGDYDHITTQTYKECQTNCLNHPSCDIWTYNNTNNQCFLKQKEQRMAKQNAISGRILGNNIPRPPVPPPNPTSYDHHECLDNNCEDHENNEDKYSKPIHHPNKSDHSGTIQNDPDFPYSVEYGTWVAFKQNN